MKDALISDQHCIQTVSTRNNWKEFHISNEMTRTAAVQEHFLIAERTQTDANIQLKIFQHLRQVENNLLAFE